MSAPCERPVPGHHVSFEQVVQAALHPHHPVDDLEALTGDAVLLTVEGEPMVLHTHDVPTLMAVWGDRMGTASWNPTARLLMVVAHHPWVPAQHFHLSEHPIDPCEPKGEAAGEAEAPDVAGQAATGGDGR